ncbi:hypothetical protein KC356_g4835 [Hortaea werneckii]|nr:hypothetical protein KC356_g4835 [Hortaea werneckii]
MTTTGVSLGSATSTLIPHPIALTKAISATTAYACCGALRKNFAPGQCGQGVKRMIVVADEAAKDLEINIFNAAFEQAWNGDISLPKRIIAGEAFCVPSQGAEPYAFPALAEFVHKHIHKGSFRNAPATQQTREHQEHMESIWPKLHALFGEKLSASVSVIVASQQEGGHVLVAYLSPECHVNERQSTRRRSLPYIGS